jgi:adenine deaminase
MFRCPPGTASAHFVGMHSDHIDPAVRDRAVAAALGAAPFDLLFTGGTVVDVATAELRPADVGIVGPLIASVHHQGERADATTTVDVSGKYLAPGFMDLHVHFESSMLTPAGYAAAVVPHGTTTVFADPHELGNAVGLRGVRYAIDAARGLPLRYVVQAPSCVPPMPGLELAGADFGATEVAEMLSWDGVAGVAEVMDMVGVLGRSDRMVDIVTAGLDAGKLVSGHAWMLSGARLQGYLAAGITSDHENFFPHEVLEKIRAGMTVELRYLIREMLPPVVEELLALPALPTNVVLCSDDVLAMDLHEQGHIDEGIRRLIACGMPPVVAIRIATYHAAYRLQRTDLGLIGPGRIADVVVLGDLPSVRVDDVYAAGRHVASAGRMLVPCVDAPADVPLHTVEVPTFTAADFELHVDRPDGPVEVRTIENPVFANWGTATVEVRDGIVLVPEHLLKHAAVHRYGRAPAVPQIGLLADWGAWTGAAATTVSHDTHNLQVFGRDAADMALAANTVAATGGGVAIVRDGEVLASIALPVAGILTDAAPDVVAEHQRALNAAIARIGETTPVVPQPIFQLFACSLACLPGPHVTDVGLVDGTTGERVASILADGAPA